MSERLKQSSPRNLAGHRRITRRQWIRGCARFAAAGVFAPWFPACARPRKKAPENNSSITVLYPDDEGVPGPAEDMPAKFLVFLPLVARNARGELEGRLAESWEHSADYRTWTVRLHEGIRWHDGVPVTAQDIKFTIDLLCRPEVLWFSPGSYSVKVLDSLSCAITCQREALAGVLDDWMVYYPKHIVENLDPKAFWEWDFWTHPIGNGPYRHVRNIPKTMMEFEANPDYYLGRPRIKRVVLKFGDTSGPGTLTELLSGSVDAATNVRRNDALKLAGDSRFHVYDQIQDDLVTVLFWNHRIPLFSDARVRRALTLAIDRRELFRALNFSDDIPILDAPLSKRQLWKHDYPEPIPYDPDLASRLLDEAGWGNRDRNGLRQRDGRPFSFTVILGFAAQTVESDAAVYIQAALRRIGIQMKINPLQGMGVFHRAVTGDYEAAINIMFTGWGPGNGPERFLSSAGYVSSQFSELAKRFQNALEPGEVDQLFRELTKLLQEDVPATFLYPHVLTTIAHKRVRGLDDSPYHGDLTWCMGDLSLEARV